jgi:hypothetical protein
MWAITSWQRKGFSFWWQRMWELPPRTHGHSYQCLCLSLHFGLKVGLFLCVIISRSWHEVWSSVCWTVFFFASNGHEYLYSSPLMRKSHVESRKITNQICCSGYIFFKEPECVLERLVSYRECRNAGLFYPRVSCVMLLLVLRKSRYVTGVITSRMFISHESMLYCFFSCIENCNM